jgi:hypothetical protein
MRPRGTAACVQRRESNRACGGADLTVRQRGSKSAGEDLTLRNSRNVSLCLTFVSLLRSVDDEEHQDSGRADSGHRCQDY